MALDNSRIAPRRAAQSHRLQLGCLRAPSCHASPAQVPECDLCCGLRFCVRDEPTRRPFYRTLQTLQTLQPSSGYLQCRRMGRAGIQAAELAC